MLDSTAVPGTNVVVIAYGGPVRADEMLDAREQVDEVVRRHDSARLLVRYEYVDPCRWEPRAMWSDLQTARVLRDVDRVAVLADTEWIDDLQGPGGTARRVEVRGFRGDRRREALAWLQGRAEEE